MTNKHLTDGLTTWIEVDLGQLQRNLRVLGKLSRKPVMAVVKANAYGHGLTEIANAAERFGSDWAGVARFEEALALRKGGFTGKVLVLGYTPPAAALLAALEEISLCVFDLKTAAQYDKQALAAGKKLNLHLKIDSGMGRLGIQPDEGEAFVKTLQRYKNLHLEGMFTHFARADEPALPTTAQQLDRFDGLVKALEAKGMRPAWVHASNSGGTLGFPAAAYDLVRPGIVMYGLSPSSKVTLPAGIKPILSLKTRLVSVKELPKGYGIGYGHRFTLKQRSRVGVLAIGYADGSRRVMGNQVLINGKLTDVIGSVCMDQCMVLLNDLPDAKIGDEVVLLGKQKGAAITAEDLARRWGTINYEVVATLGHRIPRIYLNE